MPLEAPLTSAVIPLQEISRAMNSRVDSRGSLRARSARGGVNEPLVGLLSRYSRRRSSACQ